MDDPNPILAEVERLFDEGEGYLDEDDCEEEALACFRSAWDLLPDPKEDRDVASRLLTAMGDCYFFLCRWDECHSTFQHLVKGWDMIDNPFIRLRLGQSLFELGNTKEACNWMLPAYLEEGAELFDGEDPKYLDYLKGQLDPPPGGWPEGW